MMHRRSLLAALTAGAVTSTISYADTPKDKTDTSVMRITGPDGRSFETRFRWPRALSDASPMIVFSHGFGGNMDGFPNTSRAWAEAGFITVHPTHADSMRPAPDRTELGVRVGDLLRKRATGRMSDREQAEFVALLEDPAHLDGRASDVLGILAAAERSDVPGPLKGRINLNRLGMAGHSYGAYTTLAFGGAAVLRPDGRKSFFDPRFCAFMVISGQGSGRMGLETTSFSAMTHPTVWITGSKDYGADGETPDWRLEPFRLSPPGDKYSLFIDNARHSDFDDPPGPPTLKAALLAREVAFWRSYLAASPEARIPLTAPSSPGLRVEARLEGDPPSTACDDRRRSRPFRDRSSERCLRQRARRAK